MSEMKQGGNDDDAPRCPPHPGFVGGLCSRCGAKEEDTGVGNEYWLMDDDDSDSRCGAKDDEEGGSAPALASGSGHIQGAPVLPASVKTMNVLRAPDLETLLRTQKLILILDLDHTLLNSARLDSFSATEQKMGFTSRIRDDPRISLFRVDPRGIRMLTKLRPFARDFVEQVRAMFEMYVCTLGDQHYARAVVKLLDPDGVYFSDRIVSREMLNPQDSKNIDVIPGAEAVTVVILDDTDDAWPGHQDNLILMDRYLYFQSSCRKLGYQMKSLAEKGLDEREYDGSLAVVLPVLKRIHRGFFDSVHDQDGHRADVRAVIAEVRSQVLQGCIVAFSGSAVDSPIWSLAKLLGAVCQVDVGEKVTHVVAEDPGTQVAQWARDNNKFLVNPGWIMAASFRWCRQEEQKFPVTKP